MALHRAYRRKPWCCPDPKAQHPHSSTRHSLWARLDGQDDPDQLGAAAARHVERRRQRELTIRLAGPAANMLRPPNRVMAVTQLSPDHDQQLFDLAKHIFISSDEEAIADVRVELRDRYNLDVFQRGNCEDLFSSVVLVVYAQLVEEPSRPLVGWPIQSRFPVTHRYKQKTIIEQMGMPEKTLDEALALSAQQLRAITAAQIVHHYRTDQRCQQIEKIIDEKLGTYVDKVRSGEYRGDLHCLFFLANHFRRPFRVWLPGAGSIFFKDSSAGASTRSASACAFQLMLVKDAPGKDCKPQWLPVQLMASKPKQLPPRRGQGGHRFEVLDTTDDDAESTDNDAQPMQLEQPTSGAKGKKRARFQ